MPGACTLPSLSTVLAAAGPARTEAHANPQANTKLPNRRMAFPPPLCALCACYDLDCILADKNAISQPASFHGQQEAVTVSYFDPKKLEAFVITIFERAGLPGVDARI